jgi:ATP-dependent protease HslVU (ClpYQ) peptidase subunit
VTVIAAYRVKKGCVVAVDGRVTADDTLVSNTTPKFMVQGHCVIAFAGDLGPAQTQAQYWKTRGCSTLVELRAERLKKGDADWYCLVYDRSTNVLATLCSDGCLVTHKTPFATLGAGELVAWGYLAASKRPKTIAAARGTLHKALQATADKVTSCGGRATFLTSMGKKRSVEFHTARC